MCVRKQPGAMALLTAVRLHRDNLLETPWSPSLGREGKRDWEPRFRVLEQRSSFFRGHIIYA